MKKMKYQLLKKNLYLKTLKEEKSPQDSFINNKENMITILKEPKTPENNLNNNKTHVVFNKNKFNSVNNSHTKSIKYNRT